MIAPTSERTDAEYQAWFDANRRPQIIPGNADPNWLMRYADTEMPDEIYAGPDAEMFARRRFDQQRGAWTISLYREVARG